ncbi:hypothetical protein [Paenibacillus elgii]|uniref:hypothetical protein n=1 Tax=Paenibacillus elgii TaxID=189691 RepID=UPI000248CFDC|nr:hypothetical protein [Paenibacillus elgii]
MELQFALTQRVFPSVEAFKQAKNDVKNKIVSLDELINSIKDNIVSLYSDIYSRFNGSRRDENDIIKRDILETFINENYDSPEYWIYFSILKENNIIGVCARGYTLDFKLNKEDAEESIKNIEEKKDKGYIAYNRLFANYDQAYTYCIESDFDPEYIEAVEHSKDIKETEVFYLYTQTFDTYSHAFNYAIKNMIPEYMILSSNSNITMDQLLHLTKQYSTSKYSMSYDDAKTYLNHLLSLPPSLNTNERINNLKSIIRHKEASLVREKIRNENHVAIALEIDNLMINMYQKGVLKKTVDNYTYYIYKGETLFPFGHSTSIDKVYNNVKKVYETYFNQT